MIIVGVDQRHRDLLRRRCQTVDGLQQVLRQLTVLPGAGGASVALLCDGVLGEILLCRVAGIHKGIPTVLRIHSVVGRHGVLLQQGIDSLLVILRLTEALYADQSPGHRKGITVRLFLVPRHILRRGVALGIKQGIQIGLRLCQLRLESDYAVLGEGLFQKFICVAFILLYCLIQPCGVQLAGGDQVVDGGLQRGGGGVDLRLGGGGLQRLLCLGAGAVGGGEVRPEALRTGVFCLSVIAVAGLIVVGVAIRYSRQQINECGLINFTPRIRIG